jgi:glycosyltransferase involved in cell wall biosynthesis
MKILHIHRRFYPDVGGVEKYIYELCRGLISKGIDCRVLALDYDIFDRKIKYKKYEEIDGIKVYRVPGFGHYKKPVPIRLAPNCFKWADIVHLHDTRIFFETAILFKKLFNYKIVYSTHGFIFHTGELKFLKLIAANFYYRFLMQKNIDAIICVSKQDYNYFSAWNRKSNKLKMYLIENGMEIGKFSGSVLDRQYGNLLYFGRIDKNKGLELLFKSLGKINKTGWCLDIVGIGNEKLIQRLKSIAEEEGIADKIRWHGFVSREELLIFIFRSHFCFFPSIYEGFGYTFIEALAAGCVCIANEIVAYQDIAENCKEAFLLDFSNTDATADKIEYLLSKKAADFETIRKNAKIKAGFYAWPEKIQNIIEVYDNISKL